MASSQFLEFVRHLVRPTRSFNIGNEAKEEFCERHKYEYLPYLSALKMRYYVIHFYGENV
jgi:hypothetical protein